MKDKEEKIKAAVLRGMEQDRLKLLTRQPFIGTVLMHLELIPITHGCSTAQTDGRAIYMNCRFYAGLDLEERLFVLAHETWHCVLLHFVRLQTRDPKRFNIAEDLEIHFILMKERMKEPFVLPHDPAWDGLSAEEIYEKLGHINPKKMTPPKCSKGIKPCENGGGFDEHIHNGTAVPSKEKKTDTGKDQKESIGKDTLEPALGNQAGHAPGGGICVDDSTIEKLRQIVIQSAQMVERHHGDLPEHIVPIIRRLQKPELNWKELLKQFVTSCYGGSRRWLPPARRYIGMGLYLQSRKEEKLENAVVAMDISGSMQWNLPLIFGELTSLLKSFGRYNLTVLQCDTVITNIQHFDENHPFSDREIPIVRKTGGNCFMPVFDYIRQKKIRPALLIYLTDGYLSTDDTEPPPQQGPCYPVLWILTKNGEPPVSWGKVIRLKGD